MKRNMKRTKYLFIFLLVILGILSSQENSTIDYTSQIQPIFDANCTVCHGDAGGLNLTSYDNLMLGGNSGDVIIPGDYSYSILWAYVSAGDMPPGENDLTDIEIDLIAQWISEGAQANATTVCNEGYQYIDAFPETTTISDEDSCLYVPDLEALDFTDKLVAIYGLGDQEDYAEYFCDAMEPLRDIVESKGAIVVGNWPTAGYEFEASKALIDENTFIGLCVDEDRQSELTEERVEKWLAQLNDEMCFAEFA